MARFERFTGVQKAITGGVVQTVIFPAAEIESAGMIGYVFAWSGVGNDLSDITRVRVKSGGTTIHDYDIPHLRAFQQRFFPNNLAGALTDQFLFIPLNLPDAPTQDQADICQFPAGSQAQVEVVFAATAVAGQIFLGYVQSDIEPLFTSRLYGTAMGIPVGPTTNARFTFAESAVIRALGFAQTGLARVQASISARSAFDQPGPVYSGLVVGNMCFASQSPDNGVAVTTPISMEVTLGLPGAQGSTQMLFDTSAAWPGVSEELCIWAISEQTAGPSVGSNRR